MFDLLDVLLPEGMPRYKRTPDAQKQLKAQMVLLAWCPVRARLVTRGFAARVRAYARMPCKALAEIERSRSCLPIASSPSNHQICHDRYLKGNKCFMRCNDCSQVRCVMYVIEC